MSNLGNDWHFLLYIEIKTVIAGQRASFWFQKDFYFILFVVSKKCGVQEIYVLKILWSKTFWVQKIVWVQNDFGLQ